VAGAAMAHPGSWDPAAPLPYGVAALLSTTLGCAMPDCRTTQVAADQDLALTTQQQRSTSPLMRRVASAPALKVSSGQQPTPTSSSSSSDPDAASKPDSRSISSPSAAEAVPTTCSSCGAEACRCLEVYVVSRAFSEFGGAVFNRLTPEMRRYMVDIGICHYMTVFRTPDGRFVQFDFGPQGGDVQKARGPLAALLRTARRQAAAAGGSDAMQGSGGRQAGGMVHSASLPALPVASLELSGASAAADGMVGLLDGSRLPQPRWVAPHTPADGAMERGFGGVWLEVHGTVTRLAVAVTGAHVGVHVLARGGWGIETSCALRASELGVHTLPHWLWRCPHTCVCSCCVKCRGLLGASIR
jgi:hypothetical protein